MTANNMRLILLVSILCIISAVLCEEFENADGAVIGTVNIIILIQHNY